MFDLSCFFWQIIQRIIENQIECTSDDSYGSFKAAPQITYSLVICIYIILNITEANQAESQPLLKVTTSDD